MAQTYGRGPQGHDLGVRGRIGGLLPDVVAATDDLARGRTMTTAPTGISSSSPAALASASASRIHAS